jgi:hypothetical protein
MDIRTKERVRLGVIVTYRKMDIYSEGKRAEEKKGPRPFRSTP